MDLDVQSALDSAVDHHIAGRLDKADAIYRKVLVASPDHPVALHLHGLVAHQNGDNQVAADLMLRALAREPEYYQAQSNLGLVLAELGQVDEAIARHKKALAINPSYAEAHNNLGNALQAVRRYQDAAASYKTALDIDPASPDTLSNLGAALVQLGRPREALACCRKALAMAPGSLEILINLANVLNDLERLEEAAATYQKVLKAHPDDMRTLGNLAGTLQMLSRFDEAAECYARAVAAALPASIPIMWLYSASQLPVDIPGCDLDALIEAARPDEAGDEAEFESWRGFARAGMRHRQGRHDEAWRQLASANRWPAAQMAEQAGRQAEFRNLLLDQVRASPAPAPVAAADAGQEPLVLFILGPSRAGKTTLEKLVGTIQGVAQSHERALLQNAMHQTCIETGVNMPQGLAGLPAAHAASFCRTFRQQVALPAGQRAQVLTNTHPHHIRDVLPAAALLPGVRFTFIKRDVDEVTLRIFMKRFNSANAHAYDVRAITDYLVWYNDMIDALADRLAGISMIIRYEDMIAEPAETLKRVGLLCGMEVSAGPLPELGDDRGCAGPYIDYLNEARTAGS